MIEIKRKIDSKQIFGSAPEYILVIDDEEFWVVEKTKNGKLFIDSPVVNVSKKICKASSFDLPKVHFILNIEEIDGILVVGIEFDNRLLMEEISEEEQTEYANLEVFVKLDKFYEWDKPISFSKYAEILGDKLFQDTGRGDVGFGTSEEGRFNWYHYHQFSKESILENVKPYIEKVIENHYKTINELENSYNESFLSIFSFPEQLKVPCEQYLLYFAQFLQDLGINATSNLKEEAGKVLFSVTPTDDFEALDKIREALAVYLNLPASPIVYDDSFAAMRLRQQIENLQHSQRLAVREIRSSERELRLAQTVIEHQDKIIVQKDSLIEQQNKIIEKISSKSIMMDSAENKEELEKIYEGLEADYSKWFYELTGLKANVFKIVKTAVKNTLGKEDKKSVLGLDEESQ